MGKDSKMSQADASRIQSSNAKSGNDPGFAARAQSAGDRNANMAAGGGNKSSGGGSGSGGKSGGSNQSSSNKK